ncbi:MAG: hypothetical protein IPH57_10020 [Saprospiraceae bacterium]|nr:hypothetical protein [Saprospiraceae bacterium]
MILTYYTYKCPKCNEDFKTSGALSGNTFGATLYSDAFNFYPMLPINHKLIKCPLCLSFIWLNYLKPKSIERYTPSYTFSITFDGSPRRNYVKELSINDYFEALKTMYPGDRLFIRKKIWWAFNDRIRYYDGKRKNKSKIIFVEPDDEKKYTDNCYALLELLNTEDINQKIMRAEINRNLGKFEECLKIIESIKDVNFERAKNKFRTECNKRNMWLFKLS